MGLVNTVVRGSLLRRPGRTLFSVLGVSIGIAIVVAIFTVDYNTVRQAQQGRAESWSADLEVRPARDLSDPSGELVSIPGVQAATAVYKAAAEASVLPEGGERSDGQPVSLVALEAARAADMGLVLVESGEFLRAGERDVLVGRALAERFGLEPGDKLDLARPKRAPRKDCVEGELVTRAARGPQPTPETFTVRGVLAFENVGRLGGGAVAIVDVGAGLDFLGDGFLEPNFWVARDPEVDLERLQSDLGKDFSYNIREGSVVGQQADQRAFRNGVRLAGLMALALGLFVIFHTLSMSLVERVREVGVLAALGTSRLQVALVFFTEAVVIALLAGAIGLGGGLLLAWRMLEAGISSLGLTDMVQGHFDVPWRESLGLTGLGVGIALVGSVFPLLRVRESDTIRALRGEDPEVPGSVHRGFHFLAALLILGVLPIVFFALVPLVGEAGRELLSIVFLGSVVLALLVGTPLLVPGIMAVLARRISGPLARLSPFAGLLAGRSIARNPTRIAASVAAIALVTAAFVGLRGLTGSLHYETKLWAAEAVDHKVFVHGLGDLEWQPIAAALRADDTLGERVVAIEPGDLRIESPFRILGLPADELVRFGPLAEDPELARRFAEGRGMLLSARLATQRGLSVGDGVPVATPSSGVQRFEVLAISDAYGYFADPHERAYGVVASDHLRRFFCMDPDISDSLAVRLAPGVGLEDARNRVRPVLRSHVLAVAGKERSDGLQYETGAQIREHELFDILRDFLVFDVIILLTLLIAGTGVLNGQLLSAMERFKELGVLRALGASSKQIRDSVLLESAVIGAAGSILGVLLGSGLVYVMVDALKLLSGLDLPQVGLQWDYLLAAVGAFLVTIIAGLYPIWRMNRMDPVRAVRTG
ncbi:MAG: FtsX-like permease family protein [Planctomycetota bacterium]|nr:FtsX-like permease family protein [Planctomycetota bacterium]